MRYITQRVCQVYRLLNNLSEILDEYESMNGVQRRSVRHRVERAQVNGRRLLTYVRKR